MPSLVRLGPLAAPLPVGLSSELVGPPVPLRALLRVLREAAPLLVGVVLRWHVRQSERREPGPHRATRWTDSGLGWRVALPGEPPVSSAEL